MIGLLFGSTLTTIRTPPVREKDRAYFKLAAWFNENGSAGERIAYMEVGYLGYYTDLGIVDLVGLVTPEITHRVAARDFTSGFWELEPEYLVSLEGSRFILPILDNPDFAPQYERVAELDGFDGLGLSVFRRRTPASPTDPEHDDWRAELFEPPARRQLQRLGAWAETAAASGAPGPLPSIFAPDARSSSLVIEGDTFLHGSTRVLFDPKPAERRTLEPLDALTPWVTTFRGDRVRVGFKIVSFATAAADRVMTTVRVEASARQGRGVRSHVAEWDVEWLTDPDDSPPRIDRIRRLRAESLAVDRTFFADRSAAVLGELAEDPTLCWGAEYWNGRIDAIGEPNLMGHQGIAIGDLNGDGLDDLYVAMGTGLPNKLLIRQPDGTVRDTANAAGVAWLDDTKGVLIVDTDNDGDKDLLAAIGNTIVLAKNDGTGRFERIVQMKAPTSAPFYSLSAVDFDLDGDLDIYGVRYVEQSYGVSVPLPFHDANNGPSNHLMRNDGDDRFVDVTAAVGLDRNNRRFSLIGAWADYDRDGDPDLYVANDFGRNNLYRNDGGTFTDVAAETGTEDQAAGMGVAWADYDADGDFDLYVTNMYSAAGKRVAYQPRFQQGLAPDERSAIQRHSQGNSLFVNDDGHFRDRSDYAGVRMGRWGWGSIFLDWDNDALEDLLVPNGFLTGALEDDL